MNKKYKLAAGMAALIVILAFVGLYQQYAKLQRIVSQEVEEKVALLVISIVHLDVEIDRMLENESTTIEDIENIQVNTMNVRNTMTRLYQLYFEKDVQAINPVMFEDINDLDLFFSATYDQYIKLEVEKKESISLQAAQLHTITRFKRTSERWREKAEKYVSGIDEKGISQAYWQEHRKTFEETYWLDLIAALNTNGQEE